MQKWGCQLAFSVRAVRGDKNARFSTDVVQDDEAEKQCSHSCLTMTTTDALDLETQTFSQHEMVHAPSHNLMSTVASFTGSPSSV